MLTTPQSLVILSLLLRTHVYLLCTMWMIILKVKRTSLVDSRTSVTDVKFAPKHLGLQLVGKLYLTYNQFCQVLCMGFFCIWGFVYGDLCMRFCVWGYAGCSLDIWDWRILCFLRRILWLIFGSLWQFLFRGGDSLKYSPAMLHRSPATRILNENSGYVVEIICFV